MRVAVVTSSDPLNARISSVNIGCVAWSGSSINAIDSRIGIARILLRRFAEPAVLQGSRQAYFSGIGSARPGLSNHEG